MNIYGEYFYGNKISDYGIEHGYVDYGTLAKAFDAVPNDNIMGATGYENWEQESGFVDNSEEIEELQEKADAIRERFARYYFQSAKDYVAELLGFSEEDADKIEERIAELEEEEYESPEVFQWYIVSDSGARILKEINEIVFYNSELDIYLWGVTHWGTSWDYVLTDIPCNTEILS